MISYKCSPYKSQFQTVLQAMQFSRHRFFNYICANLIRRMTNLEYSLIISAKILYERASTELFSLFIFFGDLLSLVDFLIENQ